MFWRAVALSCVWVFGRVWSVCLCCLVVLGSGLFSGLRVSLGRALWVVFRVVGVFLFVCFVVGCVFAGSFGFFLWCVVVCNAFKV